MRTQVPILALSLIFFSRSPEVGVIDDCEPPRGGRESNMGPLHEQQVLNH